ncbi:MAG: hypothetical protein ACRDRS_20770 [Pseudonocardiaceae bacterium]
MTTTDPASGVSVMLPGRLVSDNGYLVGIATLGRVTEESALIQLHQQVLGTLHLVV